MTTDDFSPSGPLTRDQAQAEFARVMSDPQHPHHAGYQLGLPVAQDYVDSVYKRIAGAGGVVEISGGEVGGPADAEGDASDDDAFRQTVDAALAERGVPMADATAEGKRLFTGKEGDALLDVLESGTLGLAPEAAVEAHVTLAGYLADLHSLRRDGASGDASGSALADAAGPHAFDAALTSALAERGIRREALVTLEAYLFDGHPAAHRHLVAYLDAMPGGARLAAYVRSAEALMALQALYQSVS